MAVRQGGQGTEGGDRMTEPQFRNKVVWFSFFFSLLVVWVHSYNAQMFLGICGETAEVYLTEHWIGDRFGQIAVPGFFMISGYLFYRDFDWNLLAGKWKRRISSVLVPYILWNFLYYMGYVVGSRLTGISTIVGKGVVPFSLPALTDAVINYTYNYVFWYLCQLIMLILLTPLLYPVLKCLWSRILLFAILWYAVWKNIDLIPLNSDALIYYAFAGSLALDRQRKKNQKNQKNQKNGQKREPFVPIPERSWNIRRGLVGVLFLFWGIWFYGFGLRTAFIPGFVISRLFAVSGLWLMVPGEWLPPAYPFMHCNFFLYATHFAVVRFINKASALILPASRWTPLVLYLIMPVIVLAICGTASWILKHFSPLLWRMLNGGR